MQNNKYNKLFSYPSQVHSGRRMSGRSRVDSGSWGDVWMRCSSEPFDVSLLHFLFRDSLWTTKNISANMLIEVIPSVPRIIKGELHDVTLPSATHPTVCNTWLDGIQRPALYASKLPHHSIRHVGLYNIHESDSPSVCRSPIRRIKVEWAVRHP